MSRAGSRFLALLGLIIVLGGALMASRPIDRARPLGRDKSHAFTDFRPKGRPRLDAIAPEDVDRPSFERLAAGPALRSPRARDHARRPGRPSDHLSTDLGRRRPDVLALPHASVPLRC
jgi:hypothetical protein